MQNKKKIIILSSVAILVILISLLTIKLIKIKNNKTEQEVSNMSENIIVEANNALENNIQNAEIINNTTNINIVEDNNKEINSNANTEEIPKDVIEKEEDNKEKAINIVKENWGTDDTVYFSFDNIDSNGKYIVCVRDKATTKALHWYTVDVKTGTFEIE